MRRSDWLNILRIRDREDMRNYELVKLIHKIAKEGSNGKLKGRLKGNSHGSNEFSNTDLNDVINIQRLIEYERPELKETS